MEKLNNKMSVRKVLVPNIANHSSILIDVAGMFLKFSFIKFRFLVDRNNKYSAYNTGNNFHQVRSRSKDHTAN